MMREKRKRIESGGDATMATSAKSLPHMERFVAFDLRLQFFDAAVKRFHRIIFPALRAQHFMGQAHVHHHFHLIPVFLGIPALSLDTNHRRFIFQPPAIRGQFPDFTGNQEQLSIAIDYAFLEVLDVHGMREKK
jgi:hypothetical protein